MILWTHCYRTYGLWDKVQVFPHAGLEELWKIPLFPRSSLLNSLTQRERYIVIIVFETNRRWKSGRIQEPVLTVNGRVRRSSSFVEYYATKLCHSTAKSLEIQGKDTNGGRLIDITPEDSLPYLVSVILGRTGLLGLMKARDHLNNKWSIQALTCLRSVMKQTSGKLSRRQQSRSLSVQLGVHGEVVDAALYQEFYRST